jgi:hypothetical protein
MMKECLEFHLETMMVKWLEIEAPEVQHVAG